MPFSPVSYTHLAYMLENAEPFEAWAKEAPDAPNLLPFLVYNSMEPWLEAAGEALSSAYPQNDVWQHGHCPVCGSPAFIGHLSGPEPSRNEGRDINKGGKRMHTCCLLYTSPWIPVWRSWGRPRRR